MERGNRPPAKELKGVVPESATCIDRRICTWCANQGNESCFSCATEGLYREFTPAPLEEWEQPPRFTMKEMLDMPAVTRLAAITLKLEYLAQFQEEHTEPLGEREIFNGKRR